MKHLSIHVMMLLLVWGISPCLLFGQSLVRDVSFDELGDLDTCYHPHIATTMSDIWYQSVGTTDLYISQCPNGNWGFWRNYDTRSYMGMYFSASFLNEFYSEAFATELIQPLDAGRLYYVKAQIESKGVASLDQSRYPLQTCQTDPQRHIVVAFSEDSILSDTPYRDPQVDFRDPILLEKEEQYFWPFGDCFEAKGGERHMGVSWNRDPFTMAAPCEPLDSLGSYYISYAFVDSLDVRPMPLSFRDTLTPCLRNPRVNFDGDRWLRPFSIRDVEIEWEDGQRGLSRTFDTEGAYRCDVVFPCGKIPGEVVVQPRDCRAFFYAPTAFSPNGDEINDTYTAVLASNIEIKSFQFRVFDRWGRKLISWEDPSFVWDGRINGEWINPGVYMWDVVITFSRESEKLGFQDKGTITILR
ncbi:MAG: T9SS type B sorting domain-containing protein [Bacteroidota bacterium]